MKKLYENIEDIYIEGNPENLTELITDIDNDMQAITNDTEQLTYNLIKYSEVIKGVQFKNTLDTVLVLSDTLSEASRELNRMQNEIVEYQNRIFRFEEMNGEDLQYADESFDAVVSRNLTWNLPHPELAYAEWTRVLKPGGVILNYDANWYAYLYDDRAQAAFDRDRENSARMGVRDENIGENFDVMEEIARQMPLSNIRRPNWDLELLKSLGLFTSADEDVWEQVWSAEEKINFASTPLFLVRARKPVEE